MTGVLSDRVETPILWKTNVSDPKWDNNKVNGFQGGGNGFLGRAILLDESTNILWSPSFESTTNALYGYDISGGGFELIRTFSQNDLGASSQVHQMAAFGGEVNAPPMQEPVGLSGCDAGFGAAALASLLAAFVLLKRRKRG
jgi:Synergist-CTERM protein sorting domain-containing protein